MANTLGLYDPLFYAQEALIALEKALGMAGVVHRGYEPAPQQKGSVIKISRPGTFTAADMPVAASDVNPGDIELRVDQWKGVSFKLTDKELAFTKEKIIEDHIRPAAYAVADAIDQSLVALYKDVPWAVAADTATPSNDFPNVIAQMFANKVPREGRHYMMSGAQEAAYLKQSLFIQANTSSDGGTTQREGYLGKKFGFDLFSNQNVVTHAPGTLNVSAGSLATVGSTNPAAFVAPSGTPAQTIQVSATTVTGTAKKGALVTIAGLTQQFALAADATFAGNAATLTITPALPSVVAGGTAVTITDNAKTENLLFHRNAFALGMAPLSDLGNQLGAKIASISDPITGLSLRSRMWYDGDNATVKVGIDALWGVRTLDPNLAVRLRA